MTERKTSVAFSRPVRNAQGDSKNVASEGLGWSERLAWLLLQAPSLKGGVPDLKYNNVFNGNCRNIDRTHASI